MNIEKYSKALAQTINTIDQRNGVSLMGAVTIISDAFDVNTQGACMLLSTLITEKELRFEETSNGSMRIQLPA